MLNFRSRESILGGREQRVIMTNCPFDFLPICTYALHILRLSATCLSIVGGTATICRLIRRFRSAIFSFLHHRIRTCSKHENIQTFTLIYRPFFLLLSIAIHLTRSFTTSDLKTLHAQIRREFGKATARHPCTTNHVRVSLTEEKFKVGQ